ncbi:MAG: c-type cytochrome, partial [Flavobacteriaceae bacterium]
MLSLPIKLSEVSTRNKFLSRLIVLLTLAFTFFSIFTLFAQEADVQAGKKLFNANCASCHKLNKKAVGPALKGVS